MTDGLSLFAITHPGLERWLAEEARALGFKVTATIPGGVEMAGGWTEAMRANLWLRGATRILVRVAQFRAMHPAQLDKRARKLPWGDWLRPGVPVAVEATSRKSRIYHAGAIRSRIEGALTETLGAKVAQRAPVTVRARIEDDLCTISIDTSGPSLHKRGLKQEVNKAPMRETMAALFLRAAGFGGTGSGSTGSGSTGSGSTGSDGTGSDGTGSVYDPMCGSGTLVIEAAEIAAGLAPGRARDFAFRHLAPFDAAAWTAMTDLPPPKTDLPAFAGSDRDAGAIGMSRANAARAGLDGACTFAQAPITEARPPDGPAGLVIVNPPYGGRVGKSRGLFPLYAAFGETMRTHFAGWRVALVTSEAGLARATGLDWQPPGPIVDHGGIKVRLWQATLRD